MHIMKIAKSAKPTHHQVAQRPAQKPSRRAVRKQFLGGAKISSPATIGDYMQWAIRRFDKAGLHFGHGTDNAWDEAVYLILSTLGLPLDSKRSVLKHKLTVAEGQRVAEIVKRRIRERKPAAYLIHKAYFSGLEFYVDERVLIPRSPIAELIERRFAPWIATGKVRRILDIGTGSGCIAIACAYAFPHAVVDAVDISAQALEVATINVKKHGVARRVNLIEADLFAGLADEGVHGRAGAAPHYDIIISNPPYVSAGEMRALPREYKHEPSVALAAGAKGLKIVERLLREASKYLASGGILIVEVGNSAAALIKAYPRVPFVWLHFERGDSEVFLLDAAEVARWFGSDQVRETAKIRWAQKREKLKFTGS